MKIILIFLMMFWVCSTQASNLYELKGDRLGMELSDFKVKYNRSVKGHNENAPMCSDSKPNQKIITLLSEAYFTDAKIVNCRTNFPFEEYRGTPPTIAGVKTKILIYHFIDNKLYKITAWVQHTGFSKIQSALVKKYGKPSLSESKEYQNRMGAKFNGKNIIWDNELSKITFIERAGNLDTSALYFTHKKLSSIAEKRKPNVSTDDL